MAHDAQVAAAEEAAINLAAQEEADRVAAEEARRAEHKRHNRSEIMPSGLLARQRSQR